METFAIDRRLSPRHKLKAPLRVRLWKTGLAERRAEAENLSQNGTFFASDAPFDIGSPIEILLKMPEEITGKPATEWRCTGRVVRVEPIDSPRGKFGVGVQFDCYEILRSKTCSPQSDQPNEQAE